MMEPDGLNFIEINVRKINRVDSETERSAEKQGKGQVRCKELLAQWPHGRRKQRRRWGEVKS